MGHPAGRERYGGESRSLNKTGPHDTSTPPISERQKAGSGHLFCLHSDLKSANILNWLLAAAVGAAEGGKRPSPFLFTLGPRERQHLARLLAAARGGARRWGRAAAGARGGSAQWRRAAAGTCGDSARRRRAAARCCHLALTESGASIHDKSRGGKKKKKNFS